MTNQKNYIEKIFQKEPEAIVLEDIERFFQEPQEETPILEFKSGEVQINDIFREIVAFLNTEGGLVFIGAPRETKVEIDGKKRNACVGDLTYSSFRSKAWLHQKIVSQISPPPHGIDILEFNHEDGNIFLIDVPQSQSPPHQSNPDARYYMRLDTEAKPAPHGLVQALFNQRTVPDISIGILFSKLENNRLKIEVRANNNSLTPADKVSYTVFVMGVQIYNSKSYKPVPELEIESYHKQKDLSYLVVKGMTGSEKIKALHFDKPMLIVANCWGVNFPLIRKACIYDPVKNKSQYFENDSFEIPDLIDRIEKFYK